MELEKKTSSQFYIITLTLDFTLRDSFKRPLRFNFSKEVVLFLRLTSENLANQNSFELVFYFLLYYNQVLNSNVSDPTS